MAFHTSRVLEWQVFLILAALVIFLLGWIWGGLLIAIPVLAIVVGDARQNRANRARREVVSAAQKGETPEGAYEELRSRGFLSSSGLAERDAVIEAIAAAREAADESWRSYDENPNMRRENVPDPFEHRAYGVARELRKREYLVSPGRITRS